jgi:antitoxin YokJ
MNGIAEILTEIRGLKDCTVLPPQGMPTIPDDMTLPPDLGEFYSLAGGALLFANRVCPGPIRILNPQEFVRIDVAITGELFSAGPFQWWFALADVMDGNYIAIDLNPDHHGVMLRRFP